MRTFNEWRLLEVTRSEGDWIRLHDVFMDFFRGTISPFANPRAHQRIVGALRQVGLDSFAEQLDALEPTPEEIEAANWKTGLGMTLGDVLRHKGRREQTEAFRRKHRAYGELMDQLYYKIAKPDPAKPHVYRWPFTNLEL